HFMKMAPPSGTKTPYGSVVPPALSVRVGSTRLLRSVAPLTVGLRATYTPAAYAQGFSYRLRSELQPGSTYRGSQSVAPVPCLWAPPSLSLIACSVAWCCVVLHATRRCGRYSRHPACPAPVSTAVHPLPRGGRAVNTLLRIVPHSAASVLSTEF